MVWFPVQACKWLWKPTFAHWRDIELVSQSGWLISPVHVRVVYLRSAPSCRCHCFPVILMWTQPARERGHARYTPSTSSNLPLALSVPPSFIHNDSHTVWSSLSLVIQPHGTCAYMYMYMHKHLWSEWKGTKLETCPKCDSFHTLLFQLLLLFYCSSNLIYNLHVEFLQLLSKAQFPNALIYSPRNFVKAWTG